MLTTITNYGISKIDEYSGMSNLMASTYLACRN